MEQELLELEQLLVLPMVRLGNFRIDTSSINTLTNYLSASTSSYGIRVCSGIDTTTIYYPSGPSTLDESYGDTYDNTKDISLTNNPRYDDELQLVEVNFLLQLQMKDIKTTSFYLMTGLPVIIHHIMIIVE